MIPKDIECRAEKKSAQHNLSKYTTNNRHMSLKQRNHTV